MFPLGRFAPLLPLELRLPCLLSALLLQFLLLLAARFLKVLALLLLQPALLLARMERGPLLTPSLQLLFAALAETNSMLAILVTARSD